VSERGGTTAQAPLGAVRWLSRTERLIAQAEADGRRRLVEINEPVRLNLVRVIDGLEALEDGDGG
jgi:hypothetical protein